MPSIFQQNGEAVLFAADIQGMKAGGTSAGRVREYEKRQVEFVASNLLIIPSPLKNQRIGSSISPPEFTAEDDLEHLSLSRRLEIEKHTTAHLKNDNAKLRTECKRLRKANSTIATSFYSSQQKLVVQNDSARTIHDDSGQHTTREANTPISTSERHSRLQEEKQISTQWRKAYEKLQIAFDFRKRLLLNSELVATDLRSQLATEKRITSQWRHDCENLRSDFDKFRQRNASKVLQFNRSKALQCPLSVAQDADNKKSKNDETNFSRTTTGNLDAQGAAESETEDASCPSALPPTTNDSTTTDAVIQCSAVACAEMLMQLAASDSTSTNAEKNRTNDTNFQTEIEDLQCQLSATIDSHKGEMLSNAHKILKPVAMERKQSKWMHIFERLKAFHSVHGHCRVKTSEDPALTAWLFYQRKSLKVYEGYRVERIDALNSVGYSWGVGHPLSNATLRTLSGLPDKVIGSCKLPFDAKVNAESADDQAVSQSWEVVAAGGNYCELTESVCMRRGAGSQAARWMEIFERLKLFKDENGHCNVPKAYSVPLCSWVVAQRHRLKDYPATGYRRMRVDALNSIGYVWGVHHPLSKLFPLLSEGNPTEKCGTSISQTKKSPLPIAQLSTRLEGLKNGTQSEKWSRSLGAHTGCATDTKIEDSTVTTADSTSFNYTILETIRPCKKMKMGTK